ncbi:MAG: ABC transporter permease [Opitutaceae bacterium]|nr:ABC transporter permease [Cytophagales bacterium]
MAEKKTHIIIEPGKLEKNYWRDVWEQRELVYILSWKDISVKYKQSVIGYGWSIFRPISTLLVFIFVFQNVFGKTTPGVPYALVVLCGIIPWQFFASAISSSNESLVSNAAMISKVYFPRIFLPVSAIMISLPDFLISIVLLFSLILFYNAGIGLPILLLPFTFLILLVLICGISFLFSALNVKYRDFRHIIAFFLQIGGYLSPVAYTINIIPAKWHWLYALNPLVGLLEAIRWSVIPNYSPLNVNWYLYSVSFSVVFLLIGIRYYRKTEKGFADIL